MALGRAARPALLHSDEGRTDLQENEFEQVVRRVRGGGPGVTLAVVLGTLAALWVGFRLLKFGLRISPTISAVVTVAGLILWMRERLAEIEDEDDDYA